METPSLFSLEIVVEKLYLPNISCHFPTIACKLLDFPVISIDLVEKNTAEAIRKKIQSKPDWILPNQFDSLKDTEDTFCFKQGKSCLFKICLQTLKSLLLNAPLYVMVLDTLPNTPKLTGNASVPLDTAIKKICTDLSKNGPDIPVIYKDTGLLRIYNLMAKEIGYMTFGYRLLYLGSTLLPHISVNESKTDVTESDLPKNDVVRDTDNMLTASQLMPKSDLPKGKNKNPKIYLHTEMLVKTVSPEKETTPQILNSNKTANVSESVLTKEEQSKDFKVPVDDNQSNMQIINHNCQLLNDVKIQSEERDPFQLYCPPPIFYRKSNSKILSSDPDVLNNKECDIEEKSQNIDENLPFGDRIQQLKNNDNLPSVVKMKNPERISQTLQNNPKTDDKPLATEMNKYPYLSAILKELSLIDVPKVLQQIIDSLKEQNSEKVSASVKGETRRGVSASTKRTPVSANDTEKQILKNKSWIRCTQQLSGRKSSLEFGLTKTHILRLNKVKLLDDEANERRKLQKVEKESRFKPEMNKNHLKSSKNNCPTLKEEISKQKPSTIGQEVRNKVYIIKEKKEVENKVNVMKERNAVGNEVNVMKERKEVENEVNAMKERNEIEVKLSGDEPTKSVDKTEELLMENIQKEAEELKKTFIKKESKPEQNEAEQIQKQSSDFTDISDKDEPLLENKTQSDSEMKVCAYSDERSSQSLESETEDNRDKLSNSDGIKSDKESKNNKKRNSKTDLEEWQKKESQLSSKQNSMMETRVINDNNEPTTNQKFKEKNKVLSFEKPEVNMHENLSLLVPLSSTSPQPRLSRGPSLQESNVSSSSMLSETPLPTPRTRRLPILIKKDSIHTDSVSSYRPSEDNDELVSHSSSKHSKSPKDYSDDFVLSESEEELAVSDQPKPKIMSENKLGYTIW